MTQLFSTSAGPPSPPQDLHVTDAGRKHICIAWKPPEKNGGSPIIGYNVEMCEAGTEKWMRINSRPIKDLKCKVEEGVVPDKEYVLRVRAVNAVGASEPSDISEKVVAKDPDCKNRFLFFFFQICITEKKNGVSNFVVILYLLLQVIQPLI